MDDENEDRVNASGALLSKKRYSCDTNGCGSKYFNLGGLVGSGIKDCCNQHDRDYCKCYWNQKHWDDIFYKCLKKVCESRHKFRQSPCKIKALTYYNIVRSSQ